MEIHKAVKQLLEIVDQLHGRYPKKKFTLDGRLVGDIGEILAENNYELELFEGLAKHHDGVTTDGKNRNVQIKTTMKSAHTFPVDHTPDFYLAIKIHEDGSYTEIFNGPGSVARKAVENRKPTKTNLHSISISALTKSNETIQKDHRIIKKKDGNK